MGDDGDRQRRRTAWLVGGGLIGVLVVLVTIVALVAPPEAGDRTKRGDAISGEEPSPPPGIIPEPGAGEAPDRPGARGGAEQLALLAAILAGLVGIVGLVWRSSRRARRRTMAATRVPPSETEGPGPPDGHHP
jgi:hypothetical protein